MKGFSIQVGPWSQGTLDAIASKGATFERLRSSAGYLNTRAATTVQCRSAG
jgi:hypothetical protein